VVCRAVPAQRLLFVAEAVCACSRCWRYRREKRTRDIRHEYHCCPRARELREPPKTRLHAAVRVDERDGDHAAPCHMTPYCYVPSSKQARNHHVDNVLPSLRQVPQKRGMRHPTSNAWYMRQFAVVSAQRRRRRPVLREA